MQGGTSSSSAFLRENGGPSSSTAAFAESSQVRSPAVCGGFVVKLTLSFIVA